MKHEYPFTFESACQQLDKLSGWSGRSLLISMYIAAMWVVVVMDLNPSPSKFVEHFFVEALISFFAPHAQEDVATDELVDDLAVGRETVEDDILVVIKLDHHVFCLPIDIPSLKKSKSLSNHHPQ